MDQYEAPPSKRTEQQSSEVPRSQSVPHQTQLDSIFLLLEDKMVTFIKKELKKIQKLLGSNNSQSLESQMADEEDVNDEEEEKRSNREAFLKITDYFLRKMKQEELAERLQSMVPTDGQELLLIKEEAPEEQRPYAVQQDQDPPLLKEEEEVLCVSVGDEQLNVKEETDVTSFLFTAVPLKHEDDEDKPLFLQLHQHRVEVRDLPTSSLADNLESTTDGESCRGAETTRNPDLRTHENDSDSSETVVSEDDEEYNDVNNLDSQLKHLTDSGTKTEKTDEDWASSHSRVPESGVKKINNGQKLFCCELCGRTFNQKGHLNKHIRIHTGQKPFCCELCDRRFTEKGHLNTHIRIHTGQKPFCCELCDRRFSQRCSLKRHMVTHVGPKQFCCELCDRKFTTNSYLNKHIELHRRQKQFCCGLCDRNFTAKSSLNTHMRIHTGQKPFCCELCNRRFTTKGNLNTHIRVHTGQKPFCCELCERKFSHLGSLNKHMKTHIENKAVIFNNS